MVQDTTKLPSIFSTTAEEKPQPEPEEGQPVSQPVSQQESQPTYQEPTSSNRVKVFLAKSGEEKALNEGLSNIGRVGVVLPDKEAQLKGFYLEKEQAAHLVGQFPQYKFDQKKGEKNTQSISLK